MSQVLKDVRGFFIPVLLMFPFSALSTSFSKVKLFKTALCIINVIGTLCRQFGKHRPTRVNERIKVYGKLLDAAVNILRQETNFINVLFNIH